MTEQRPKAQPPGTPVRDHKGRMVHPVDEVLPPQNLFLFGLQHLFIMYAGAVAVPLIVGPAIGLSGSDIALLVSADLVVSGIATIIQSAGIWKILGVRLPVVAGATFTVLNPMIIIASQYGGRAGLPYVYGGMMISGIFGLLIAKPFSMIVRFFPPLVTGTVICIIGLSLGGAGIDLINNHQKVGSVSDIALAGIVILLIIVFSRVLTGFLNQIAVLLSIIVGTVIAAIWGKVHFSNVKDADWVGLPKIFHFGHPKFAAAAVITMCIVIIVTYTESTADMLAVAELTGKDLTPNDLARGLATDGLSALIASFTNSFPDTAFAENVGLVGLTKIKSRWVVTTTGVMLLVMGLVPKIGQIIADMPGPVIGGAAIVMFAMVTAVGIQTLHKVDFEGNHNLLIVATSLAVGLLPAFDSTFYDNFPKDFRVIFGSSITATGVLVFVLNLIFNHWTSGTPRESAVQAAVDEGAVVYDVPGGGIPGRVAEARGLHRGQPAGDAETGST